jgi:hypothetical protein
LDGEFRHSQIFPKPEEAAMQANKVVARFKDGSIIKGKTSDFLPNKETCHLETSNGEIKKIYMEQLKAFFFVRDFAGDKTHQKSYNDKIAGAGRKIMVRFSDGEEVIGYTLGYSPGRKGFIMTPADLKSNNERIFVVTSASEKIEFL